MLVWCGVVWCGVGWGPEVEGVGCSKKGEGV